MARVRALLIGLLLGGLVSGTWALLLVTRPPDPEAVLLAYSAALSERDPETAQQLFDERALVVRPPSQRVGPEGVREWLQFNATQYGRVQITDYRVDGERVVYRFRGARNAGRRVGQSPDELTAEIVVRNGKIVSTEIPASAEHQQLLTTAKRAPVRDPDTAATSGPLSPLHQQLAASLGVGVLASLGLLAARRASPAEPELRPVNRDQVGPMLTALHDWRQQRLAGPGGAGVAASSA